ncbi:hypothetical protein [Dyella sp. RRB7]|uniref:hypothetical protein n=1 Tax=Dyella sp. RRB7 TaxID=2919502 RepID=UPI001FA9FAB6|nr:hypothetical protein [Dyella sp. RRB7]
MRARAARCLVAQSFVHEGRTDGTRIYGERNIYGWMQRLAVACPDNEAAQFMYVTALAKGRRCGSPIVDEFEQPASERLRSLIAERRHAANLAPLLVATFPENTAIREMAAAQPALHDPAYQAWKARLAAGALLNVAR